MSFELQCPVPRFNHETIQMAHGAGGVLSRELTRNVFLPCFGNSALDLLDDQAKLSIGAERVAFTTDTFVISPIFFPGGTIGDLAVNGTVNDLAVGGAMPLYLSAGFVLEEGFPLVDLQKVVRSMADAACKAGVQIVTGDTKVVERGQCDGIFINTSGLGVIKNGIDISCMNLKPGDSIIVSGTLGDHGMAVMAAREGLSFQSEIISDTMSLCELISEILDEVPEVHAMRDPTRGGLAATLNELAEASGKGIVLEESAFPVRPDVQGACELLGIDPLNVANEGKVVVAVPRQSAGKVLRIMQQQTYPSAGNAAIIGEVVDDHPGMVIIRTLLGSRRILEMPLGEQLPRIC